MSTETRTGPKGPEVSARLRRAGPMRDRRERRRGAIHDCAECGAPTAMPNALCAACMIAALGSGIRCLEGMLDRFRMNDRDARLLASGETK